MSVAETISLLRAHCDANDKRERATFSIASIRELLAFVDDCTATIKPFPPLPSREVGGKASMSRELLGAVVDDVFDGAIEDPSVIEDIYSSIKLHEATRSANTEPVGEPLELPYKNWRGEISTRKIQPIRLEFGATEWHPEPQWLLVATDVEKNAERSFALKDFNPQQPAPAVAVKALVDAANEVIASSSDTYKKRNGHIGSFEDASGEKCWIVPFDAFEGLRSALYAQVQDVTETLETYYQRQIEWSRKTFGPALRTKGIIDHITKELREIEADPHDLSEWVDVVILAMDGFWRHGGNAEDLFKALIAKQKKNMARTWLDWRRMSEDSAIEHDRSMDEFADTFDRLKAIIVKCVGVNDLTSITREAELVDDVGLDSLDTVEIVMAAEEHFGVEIDDKDVALIVTMQDAVSAVDKARASIASNRGDAS